MKPKTRNKLETTLQAGYVQRYHATPFVKEQTVAEHSWGVLVLYMHLCAAMDLPSSKSAMFYCASHDAAELFTGDSPFTLKRDHPHMKMELDKIETHYEDKFISHDADNCISPGHCILVKFADWIEGMRWCAYYEIEPGKPILRAFADGVIHKWKEVSLTVLTQEFPEDKLDQLHRCIDGLFNRYADTNFTAGLCGEATRDYVNQG